eukprot:5860546-Amphidinium_carterae.1
MVRESWTSQPGQLRKLEITSLFNDMQPTGLVDADDWKVNKRIKMMHIVRANHISERKVTITPVRSLACSKSALKHSMGIQGSVT